MSRKIPSPNEPAQLQKGIFNSKDSDAYRAEVGKALLCWLPRAPSDSAASALLGPRAALLVGPLVRLDPGRAIEVAALPEVRLCGQLWALPPLRSAHLLCDWMARGLRGRQSLCRHLPATLPCGPRTPRAPS